MDNVLFLLFIMNSVIVHMIGLSLFLDKSNFTFKRIRIYSIWIVSLIIICMAKLINDEFCKICFVICISNFFYESNFFEKIWTNLFVITVVYLISSVDTIFIAKYLYNSSLNEAENQVLIQLRILLEVSILYVSLKRLNVFKRKVHLVDKMTTPKCIIVTFSCIVIILVGYILKLLYFKEYYKFGNMSYISYIFILMLCVTVIIFAFKQENKELHYMYQHRYMVEQLDRQVVYYSKLETINRQTRGIKHDMNNHMIVIKSLLDSKELNKLNEYISQMTSSIKLLENTISTGNTIVDAILSEKLQLAKDMSIKVEYEFNLNKSLNLEDVDICIIFSNTIDNAIEACGKLEESKRFIKMRAICDRGYLIYNIKNSSNETIDIHKKGYTSKKDSINHGYGMNNIINTIKINNGRYKITSDETSFLIEMDVPLANKE